MKTQTVVTYHCISCGRVEHAEVEAESPQCCGQTMNKACVETLPESDVAGENSAGEPKPATPVIQGRKKPR